MDSAQIYKDGQFCLLMTNQVAWTTRQLRGKKSDCRQRVASKMKKSQKTLSFDVFWQCSLILVKKWPCVAKGIVRTDVRTNSGTPKTLNSRIPAKSCSKFENCKKHPFVRLFGSRHAFFLTGVARARFSRLLGCAKVERKEKQERERGKMMMMVS